MVRFSNSIQTGNGSWKCNAKIASRACLRLMLLSFGSSRDMLSDPLIIIDRLVILTTRQETGIAALLGPEFMQGSGPIHSPYRATFPSVHLFPPPPRVIHTHAMAATTHSTGALGVVEVEVPHRKWALLSLLDRCLHRVAPDRESSTLWRWGLALEETAEGTGAVEVAWSKAAGVRAGDVVLAVNGRLVAGQGVAAVEKLLASLRHDEGDIRPLRLTLDTTKGWGVSSGMRRRQQQRKGWYRLALAYWVLDGYERLFDARCCPRTKHALHALALVCLYPLVESAFQSTNTLSREHGPLVLLPHARLLAFERLWSLAFVGAALALGLAFACPLRRPRAGAVLAASSALLLRALLLSLLIPPAVVALTVGTSGFVLLPPQDPSAVVGGREAYGDGLVTTEEEEEEERLQLLLAHVLCALLLPLLTCAYFRRLVRFCAAYAALLRPGRNPKLLTLTMPLSSHFVTPVEEERERFLALRASGY